MANPERENLTELQVARFKFFYDLLKTVRHLFRLAKWMGICVFSYLSIDALAGKTTILNAVFKYAAGNKLALVDGDIPAFLGSAGTCVAAAKNSCDARTHSQTRNLVRSCPDWNQPASGRSNQPEGQIGC